MDLHRTSGLPDWAEIPTTKRNIWQRLAARTNGVLTPGNLFTVLGLMVVLAGLYAVTKHQYIFGFIIIVVGRLCDLLDGMFAQATGTKSPLGEKLDAGFDKLVSVAAFICLVAVHVIPVVASLLIFMPNFSTALLTVIASRRGVGLQPSRYGKLFMAAGWVAIGGFVMAAAAHATFHVLLFSASYILGAIAFGFGVLAGAGYIEIMRDKAKSR